MCVELIKGRLVMANFGYLFDYIWNHLNAKQLSMPIRDFLDYII